MKYGPRYMALMGMAPKQIPHWEHWACPDAETHITGIDYYVHPKKCRLKMQELYPYLNLPVPESDDSLTRPITDTQGRSSTTDEQGRHHVRWGDGESMNWDWGKQFRTAEDVFAFSPLQHADFTDIPVVESQDYSSENILYERYRKDYPAEWGDKAPEGSDKTVGFYNTMFMWPLLTFGWELFLETCLDSRFEKIMNEFSEINRRVFRAFARLPVNFVICHDDIATSRGPVCSPSWMNKYIFPRYEEFWGIVKSAGKEVIFMADGCVDAFVDDIFACGARGIITESYTDFKGIARRHENCFLSGEGDSRVLYRNRPEEIEKMVKEMVETAKMTGGYMMSIGNHIPWNIPPQAVKYYLDLSKEIAHR